MTASVQNVLFIALVAALLLATPTHAFGAGSKAERRTMTCIKLTDLDIASISAIEGRNFRHGDIEDALKLVACIKGHKWTSMMIKRVYFGYEFRQWAGWMNAYAQVVATGCATTPRLWIPALCRKLNLRLSEF